MVHGTAMTTLQVTVCYCTQRARTACGVWWARTSLAYGVVRNGVQWMYAASYTVMVTRPTHILVVTLYVRLGFRHSIRPHNLAHRQATHTHVHTPYHRAPHQQNHNVTLYGCTTLVRIARRMRHTHTTSTHVPQHLNYRPHNTHTDAA